MIDEFGLAPDNSSMLEINDSTTGFFATHKGLLIPRLTQVQRDAISSPATGLLIYQLDVSSGYYWNIGTPISPNWFRITDESQITNPDLEDVLIEGDDANGQAMYGIDSLGVDNASPPSSQLHINESAGSTSILLITDLASGTTINDGFRLAMISGNSELRNIEDGPISFSTNLLERMRLTNNGLALDSINSTSPLFVNGSARIDRLGINSAFSFPLADGSNTEIITTDGAGGLSWSANTTADNMGNHIAIRNIFAEDNFISNDGDSEGMFVDTLGNAGIGITDLYTKFTVYDPTFPLLRICASTGGPNNIVDAAVLELTENNTSDIDTDGYGFKIRYVGNGSNTDQLQFWSKNNGAEDLTMTLKRTSRRVGIGVQEPLSWFHVVHIDDTLDGVSISNDVDSDRWHFHLLDTNGLALYFNDTLVGAFNSATGAYLSLSDERTKRDIAVSESIGDRLRQLNIVEYHYLDQLSAETKEFGIIAQDLEKVFPALVKRSQSQEEEVYSVNYGGLNALAIAGANEQYTELQELEKRLEKLEQKVKSKKGK